MATIRIAIILVAVFAYGVSAQSPAGAPADAPAVDCMTSLLNMSDCLTYVEAGSNLTVPEKACCPELAGLVDSNPICLCQLVGHTDSFGIKIDLNKALKLPSLCRVTTPPISLCSVVGVPIGGPTASDESLSPGGSAAIPSPGNNDNGALRITDSSQIALLLGLIIDLELFKRLEEKYGQAYKTFMMNKLVLVVGNGYESYLGTDDDLASEIAKEVNVIINSTANKTFDERFYIHALLYDLK